MLPNLAVLEKKCKDLGLNVTPKGKRPAKSDYVEALRTHFLPAGGLPYEEVEPMLCFPIWDLKPEEAEGLWMDPRWVAQKKLNGCRIVLHFVKGKGTYAHSRTTSVKTFRMQELTDKLLIEGFVPNFDATVDAEIMIEKPVDTRPYTTKGELTKSSLHSTTAVLHLAAKAAKQIQKDQDAPFTFKVFDIMSYQGKDKKGWPLSERLVLLHAFMMDVLSTEIGKYFELQEVTLRGKKEFFEKILAEGGEGVVLKNLDATYEASSSRRRDGWVKAKKRIEFDAYVVGFERGDEGAAWRNLVGDLLFAVKTEGGKEHTIAKCSNLTMELRKAMTNYDATTDTVSLKPEWYGRVAEVSGQDVSPRSLRLSHATIDRWRFEQGPDHKAADDCRANMADLVTRSEWVG